MPVSPSLSSPTGSELVYEFHLTTPAGTAEDNLDFQDINMPNLEVQWVQWVVPPGPLGNLGWQLWYSGALVVPQNGTFVVTDDEKNSWELEELPTGGSWGLVSYNTGKYDHTLYLRFLLNPLAQQVQSPNPNTVQTVAG